MPENSPIPTPIAQRLRRLRLTVLPFLVWLGASVLAVYLWLSNPAPSMFAGLVVTEETSITSPSDGLIVEVHVAPFDTVAAGQPLASLSNATVDAKLLTAEAELEKLGIEIGVARAQIEREHESAQIEAKARHDLAISMATLELPAELRAFYDSENALELSILELKLQLAKSELKIADSKLDLEKARAGANNEDSKKIKAAQGELAMLEAEAASQRLTISTKEARLAEGRQRREALMSKYAPPPEVVLDEPDFDELLAGWTAAVAVQQSRIAELILERDSNIVRAPGPGRVTVLSVNKGHFAMRGEQLLVLASPLSHEVHLWIPEALDTQVQVGDPFEVARAYAPRSEPTIRCSVRAHSPRVEQLPRRLWQNSRIAEYGRAVILAPPHPLPLLQGERVFIKESKPDEAL